MTRSVQKSSLFKADNLPGMNARYNTRVSSVAAEQNGQSLMVRDVKTIGLKCIQQTNVSMEEDVYIYIYSTCKTLDERHITGQINSIREGSAKRVTYKCIQFIWTSNYTYLTQTKYEVSLNAQTLRDTCSEVILSERSSTSSAACWLNRFSFITSLAPQAR